MIVYHHTPLAGLLPFLHGKLNLVPRGFKAPTADHVSNAEFDWAEADRFASLALGHDSSDVRGAAEAFVAAARHTRLRAATNICSASFITRDALTHHASAETVNLTLGLDSRTLDRLPNAVLIPAGAEAPERVLEATLVRRRWREDAPPQVKKREAALLFVASLLATSEASKAGTRSLVVLSSRLHQDPRLHVELGADGTLEPRLEVELPRRALVELALAPRFPPRQVAALSLLLRRSTRWLSRR